MPLTTTTPIVAVSALDGGHLTLPTHLFTTPSPPTARTTVPTLCFLLRHPTHPPLLFDLGLKRNLAAYAPAQQSHIAHRHPITTSPDCAASLRAGGLDPATAIGTVLLSHVHWDHVGTPADYPAATFVVGAGTRDVLRHGCGPHYPAAIFNADELPAGRVLELPPVPGSGVAGVAEAETLAAGRGWERLGGLEAAALDLFGDGSVWVVDAPGHLVGHVNLLVRVGARRWVYLGGDCCHDPRILRGESEIAMYDDGRGGLRSVHADTEEARGTLERIRGFLRAKRVGGEEGEEVEVEAVVAHDKEWRERNGHRFFPGTL